MASARHQRTLARTAGTTPQALYPPPLNIGFLPFTAFLAAGFLAPSYLVLALAYLFTLICGMYALLLTSSQYGIAAAHRAHTEGLLSPSSQHRYISMHCLPFADLISSIWLYIVLHRAQKLASDS